jgi:hypothetical protein
VIGMIVPGVSWVTFFTVRYASPLTGPMMDVPMPIRAPRR